MMCFLPMLPWCFFQNPREVDYVKCNFRNGKLERENEGDVCLGMCEMGEGIGSSNMIGFRIGIWELGA